MLVDWLVLVDMSVLIDWLILVDWLSCSSILINYLSRILRRRLIISKRIKRSKTKQKTKANRTMNMMIKSERRRKQMFRNKCLEMLLRNNGYFDMELKHLSHDFALIL